MIDTYQHITRSSFWIAVALLVLIGMFVRMDYAVVGLFFWLAGFFTAIAYGLYEKHEEPRL